MRNELSHLTMSARSRTAAGPRERGWSRAVPGVLCENHLHSRTRTSVSLSFVPSVRAVGHVFFCADDMLFFCLSQVCLICYMLSCVSPHFRLDSSPCRPVFASSPLHGDYLSTDTLGVPFSSLPRKTLESAPRRHRSAEQPHGSFVTVKTQASSRSSGHRARVIFRLPPLL